MGKFIITRRINNQYQFLLLAQNGEIILKSEGYISKSSCLNGIQAIIKNSIDINRFERRTSTNGKYYFNLKAINGEIIGTSEFYESLAGRENGIYSVQRNAQGSVTEDRTL